MLYNLIVLIKKLFDFSVQPIIPNADFTLKNEIPSYSILPIHSAAFPRLIAFHVNHRQYW